MPIAFKDFFPTVLKSGFFSNEHEELTSTVARASLWVREAGVRVINIETVVLPNIDNVEDAAEAGIRTSGDMGSYWYQVIRVWHDDSPSSAG